MLRVRKLKKFGSLLAATAIAVTGIFTTPSDAVFADDANTTYSYTYDIWGEMQSSPDAYRPTKHISGDMFEFEQEDGSMVAKNFVEPQGQFIRGNKIYVCDTAWSKGAGLEKEYGRLFAQSTVSSFSFRPGSIVHAWDQAVLGYESSNTARNQTEYEKATHPWHTGKTWNYSFIDGHASNLHPEQTHCHNCDPAKPGTFQDVLDNTPNGMWTWNHKNWGNE